MEYKVYYNGQETNDIGTLASWFVEVYNKMIRLKDENERLKREYDIAQDHITENEDCIHSMSNDMNALKNLNESLKIGITAFERENEKTSEILKRYCGDSVDAPIPTMVGLIIDDYFYQKNETEHQVKELQKAEKTIDKLNKELVEYADKAEKLEKDASFIPTLPTLAEKINDITCRYHMPVTPLNRRKARTEDIFQCVQELAEYADKQRKHIYTQDSTIASQTERINELEKKNEELEKMRWLPDWCQVIDKLDEIIDEEAPEQRPSCLYLGRVEEIIDKVSRIKNAIHGRNQVLDQRKATIDRLRKENELLNNRQNQAIADKLNEIIDKEAPVPFIPLDCKKVYTNAEDEIWDKLNYLSKSLCLRNNLIKSKNKRIRELENKVNELDVANRRLKLENEKLIHVQGDNAIEHAAEVICMKGEIADLKKAVNSALEDVKKYKQRYNMALVSHFSYYGMGADAENHKLREENNKLKDALEFCQKEASSAREHAHNVEVNAERIRKGLD